MQKYLTIIGFCVVMAAVNIQAGRVSPDQDDVPGITWDKLEHDFGEMRMGDTATTDFTISNNRKDTLVIENVLGGCYCTSTKWTRPPVLPGMKGVVRVSFNSKGKMGVQNKDITVYTNKGYFILAVKANIIK